MSIVKMSVTLCTVIALTVSAANATETSKKFTDNTGGVYRKPTISTSEQRANEHDYLPDRLDSGSPKARMFRAMLSAEDKLKEIESGKVQRAPEPMTPAKFQSLLNAAQNGDASAMGKVGRAYQYGQGTEKNEQKAVEWYTSAASSGQTQYYTVIGNMYRSEPKANDSLLSGIGQKFESFGTNSVSKDDQVARQWYERGVMSLDSQAMMRLAVMYRDGEGGLEKDVDRARDLYNRSLKRSEFEQKERALKMKQELLTAAYKAEGLPTGEEQKSAAVLARPEDFNDASMSKPQTISVGNGRCTYIPSSIKADGYSAVYEANCAGELGVDANSVVSIDGAPCRVQSGNAGSATHRFFCGDKQAAAQVVANKIPDLTIGGAACNLAARQGERIVYDAVCNQPIANVTSVDYRGYKCTVNAGSAENAYVLDCPKEDVKPVTLQLGRFTCSMQPLPYAEGQRSTQFEGYCGGLTDEQKATIDISKPIAVGDYNCTMTPASSNSNKKDFDASC